MINAQRQKRQGTSETFLSRATSATVTQSI